MARFLARILGMLLIAAVLLPAQGAARVIAMPAAADLEGTVAPNGMPLDEAFLKAWRRERDAVITDGTKTVILELTSQHGSLEVAEAVVDDLFALRDRGVRVVGHVPEHARGAAVLVLMACAEVVAAPGADLGTRGAPDFSGDARTLNDRLDRIVKLSADRGTFGPLVLLDAMVHPERELLIVNDRRGARLVEARAFRNEGSKDTGAVLTTWKAAGQDLELISGGNTVGIPGFALPQAHSREDAATALGCTLPLEVRKLALEPRSLFGFSFGDSLVGLLLIALGLFFLTIEFKTPGVGLSGALALVCFIAGFVLQGGDGPPLFITAGLLILGLLLLAVELLILPGFGVAGVAGVLLILFSIYAATVHLPGQTFLEQTIPDSEGDWSLVRGFGLRFLASLIASVTAALLLFPALRHLPIFRQAFLAPPVLEPVTSGGVSPAARGAITATGFVTIAVGTRGKALTTLRPSGRALLDGHEVDVVSDGRFIGEGSEVVVISCAGSRVEVRPLEGTAP